MPRDSAVFGPSWIEPKPARLVEGLGRVAQWGNFGGKQCDPFYEGFGANGFGFLEAYSYQIVFISSAFHY